MRYISVRGDVRRYIIVEFEYIMMKTIGMTVVYIMHTNPWMTRKLIIVILVYIM